MTSSHSVLARSTVLGVLLLLAVAPVSAASDAAIQLRQLIKSSSELHTSFGDSEVNGVSQLRAEASATINESRHAVVLFKEHLQASIGQQFCHSALVSPERTAWQKKIAGLPSSDEVIAEQLAVQQAVRVRLRNVEYLSVKGPDGWQVGICVVKLADFNLSYPHLPDQAMINASLYTLGKQLFGTGNYDMALQRFKALKLDPKYYPNALMYIIAILDQDHPEIADGLRQKHINLPEVNDIDALMAYAKASVARNQISDAEIVEERCIELGDSCYPVSANQTNH